MIKILKSKKGSTLVLVMVVLSILSMLGTAIISVSVVNYKMKIVDKNVKTSFYMAEAGFEEASAIINKEIEEAIKAGNAKVEDELSKFIEEQRIVEKENPKHGDTIFIDNSDDPDNPDGVPDGYGKVNKKEIKPVIEEWFRLGFAKHMNGTLGDEAGANVQKLKKMKSLKEQLMAKKYTIVNETGKRKDIEVAIEKDTLGKESVVEFNIQHNSVSINSSEKKLSPDVRVIPAIERKDNKPKPYEISLIFTVTHKNIEKKVKGAFKIDIPPYNDPYYIKNVMAKMDDNILWKKAITTDKDLYITGKNTVTINGDIYAYGTIPENEEDKKDETNFKGIVVGDNNKEGHVEINGNVSTNSYVQTNANNSMIEINGGDVYCNSLVIPNGVKGSTITTTDTDGKVKFVNSVNTEDDIELNGSTSHININSNYYGFSDGSNYTKHDSSSSIVINSPDIGTGSSLKITGETYIAGTVYINHLEEFRDPKGVPQYFDYQTGESVSIQRNYKAYGEELSDTPTVARDTKFKPESVEFENYAPLLLLKRGGQINDPVDKSKYIRYYYEDYQNGAKLKNGTELNKDKDSKNDLNLGGATGVTIPNRKYSVGAYIDKNTIYEGMRSNHSGDIEHVFRKKKNEYRYQIDKMADPIFDSEYHPSDDIEITKDESSRIKIDRRFSFDKNIIHTVEKTNENVIVVKDYDSLSDVKNTVNVVKELILVNNDPDKSIAISGPHGNKPTDVDVKEDDFIELNNSNLKGIIVTAGELYITGEIDYTGIIVAKGDIHIQDDNPKTISNKFEDNKLTSDRKYILNTVYALDGKDEDGKDDTSPNLKNLFVNKRETKVIPVDPFLHQSKAGVDDTNAYINYDNIVHVSWEKIK